MQEADWPTDPVEAVIAAMIAWEMRIRYGKEEVARHAQHRKRPGNTC